MRCLIVVGLTIGLGLLPVPLDAATKEQPNKMASSRTERAAVPDKKVTGKNRILPIRHFTGKSRNPQQSARSKARREAAALRRLMLMRQALLGAGQQPRLLESWKIRPIDGDTFAYGAERIRLRGINAPETSEAGSFEARQRLESLLREGPVIIVPHGEDSYGRTLADVFVNERNVAEVMKTEGYEKQR